jgi:putative ABC transport system ATP-binding protein
MPDLHIADLTIEYVSGEFAVRPVESLSFGAKAGSLALLLGPSGCGKTSLLSCIGGILRPSSGSIEFDGVAVNELVGSALTHYRQCSVGIVFQAFNLVPSLSALENVAVPLQAAGKKWPSASKRAAELLDRLDMADRIHHRPGELSGGQQQRVAIARALALDPPLILADEPTAHLDYVQVEGILQILRELASNDRVVVVATHDHRLLRLGDQIVNLAPEADEARRAPEKVTLQAGEVLFRQNSRGDLIYVVESGEIEIVVERTNGTEEVKAVVTIGDYFGEMGPLFSLPRTATARARSHAQVVGYSVRDFRERLGPDHELLSELGRLRLAASHYLL